MVINFTHCAAVATLLLGSFFSANAADETPNFPILQSGFNNPTKPEPRVEKEGEKENPWRNYTWCVTQDFKFPQVDDSYTAENCYLEFDLKIAPDGKYFIEGESTFGSGITWMDNTDTSIPTQNVVRINFDPNSWNYCHGNRGTECQPLLDLLAEQGMQADNEWHHISVKFADGPNYNNLSADGFIYSNFAFERFPAGLTDYMELKNFQIIDKGHEIILNVTEYPITEIAGKEFQIGGYNEETDGTKEVGKSMNFDLRFDPVDVSDALAESTVVLEFTITPKNEGEEITEDDMNKMFTHADQGLGGILNNAALRLSSASNHDIAAMEYGPLGKKYSWHLGNNKMEVKISDFNSKKSKTDEEFDPSKINLLHMYFYNDNYKNTPKPVIVKYTNAYIKHAVPEYVEYDPEEEDIPTGITDINDTMDTNAVIYNLNGVKVYGGNINDANLPHGLYIVVDANGSKKVMM